MKWDWDFIRGRRTEIPNSPLPTGERMIMVNGHAHEIQGAHLSDMEVAGRVRMLHCQQLDHESICTLARDRIVNLSDRLGEIESHGAVSGEHEGVLGAAPAQSSPIAWMAKPGGACTSEKSIADIWESSYGIELVPLYAAPPGHSGQMNVRDALADLIEINRRDELGNPDLLATDTRERKHGEMPVPPSLLTRNLRVRAARANSITTMGTGSATSTESRKARKRSKNGHRVAMEAGAITCQGGSHIYPLKDEMKALRAQVGAGG
jgi:hypothetical protein